MQFNIDRWWSYTKQKEHVSGHYVKYMTLYGEAWCKPTAKQLRRIKHKKNARNDTSIGIS